MKTDADLDEADLTTGDGPFTSLTPYQRMRRIWGSMDRCFKLTVILRSGRRVVGEYCGLFSSLNELILWDDAQELFTIKVSDIRDVDLPPNPIFSYI